MEQSTPAVPVIAAAASPARHGRGVWREWLQTALVTLVIFIFMEAFVVQGYKVYGNCMEPNLYTGERLLGSKIACQAGVSRGDIVVFRPPHQGNSSFIKRIVALPGEVIEIRHSKVSIDGRPLREPYLHNVWHDDLPPTRVREGMVFVMGDNRDNSSDSRMWGELPVNNIQAKAWLRYWPPARIDLLR